MAAKTHPTAITISVYFGTEKIKTVLTAQSRKNIQETFGHKAHLEAVF